MNDTTKNEIRERWRKYLLPECDENYAIADLFLNLQFKELSRLDQERVEKVRGMFKEFNPENIEFSDPVKVDGWNKCLSAVLTNVFNVEE